MQQSCNFWGLTKAEMVKQDPESLKLEELGLFHCEGLKKLDMKYKVTESVHPIRIVAFLKQAWIWLQVLKSRGLSFYPESNR